MTDSRLEMLIDKLEIVHYRMRNFRDSGQITPEISSGFDECYSLIGECREILHEEEVKNEISGYSGESEED